MAVADARRGSKRRKLSPPEEDRTQHSKKKSETEQNGDSNTNNSAVSVSRNFENMEMPSVKGLDSSEPAIRRSTLKTMLENLGSRPSSTPFTNTQCLQLWRGFFVAIYMHDSRNALSVQNLLREIAGTFSIMASKDDEIENSKANETGSGSLADTEPWLKPYHSAFWETAFSEPEHANTEPASKPKSKKRSAATQETVQNPTAAKRSMKKTEECLEVLDTVGPLNPSQRRISDGLRLHVLDVLNDELFGALDDLEDSHKLAEDDTRGINMRVVQLVPLFSMIRTSVEKTTPGDSGAQKNVRLRAKDTLKVMSEQLEERSMSLAVPPVLE